MWCYTYCPFNSRFRNFLKKKKWHLWNLLQHSDSISVSIATNNACIDTTSRLQLETAQVFILADRMGLSFGCSSSSTCFWSHLLYPGLYRKPHVQVCSSRLLKICFCISLKIFKLQFLKSSVSHSLTVLRKHVGILFTFWDARFHPPLFSLSCLNKWRTSHFYFSAVIPAKPFSPWMV